MSTLRCARRMVHAAALAWCGTIGLATTAHADDAAARNATLAFDLPGIWSTDCSKPASRSNPYIMWEVPAAGPVKHRITFDGQWPAPDLVAADGALLDDGRLRLSLLTNGEPVMTITMEKAQDRLHTVEIRDGHGTLRMTGGVWIADGKPTGSSERCKDVRGAAP